MADIKLTPLGDKIIVESKKETVTRGGIVLPDTAEEKPQIGTVIAVGPGKVTPSGKKIEMTLKVGNEVLFTKYSPTEFKFNDKEYLIMSESDVLAIVK